MIDIKKRLQDLLGEVDLLSVYNKKEILSVYYDAVKVIYYKQQHMNKSQLKTKEIARCLDLVYYHRRYDVPVEVVGTLLENMGGEFSEDSALNYYQKEVMGVVTDKLGQDIVIDEIGIDFLYDQHEIKSENYREARGKRLPWIRHVIQNSREIYTKQERNSLLYIYVSQFLLTIGCQTMPTWFLVFAKKRKDIDKTLAFLTAIPVDRYNGFLSKLESMSPVK